MKSTQSVGGTSRECGPHGKRKHANQSEHRSRTPPLGGTSIHCDLIGLDRHEDHMANMYPFLTIFAPSRPSDRAAHSIPDQFRSDSISA